MSEFVIEALCVRAEDYGESDKILTLIEPKRGKITVSAKSVRGFKSKLKLAASPLCFGNYSFVERKGRNTLTGCGIIESFLNCWQDIDKNAASQIILETLDKTTKEEMQVENEFQDAVISISYINEKPVVPYIYSLWFLARLLVYVGIDVSDNISLSENTKNLISAIGGASLDDLETFEISLAQIVKLLNCISLSLQSELSVYIKSIASAVDLLSGN